MLSGLASNQGVEVNRSGKGWVDAAGVDLRRVVAWHGQGGYPRLQGSRGGAGSLERDGEHVFRRLVGISWMVAGKSGLVRWVGG